MFVQPRRINRYTILNRYAFLVIFQNKTITIGDLTKKYKSLRFFETIFF